LAATLDEWYAAIERLAAEPELRLQLAHGAQETLRTQGMLSHHLASWQEILDSALSNHGTKEPPTALSLALLRFSEAVQLRSDERNLEVSGVNDLLKRSEQLEEILQSRLWRYLRKLHHLRRFLRPPPE